jgi:hypothetical protein
MKRVLSSLPFFLATVCAAFAEEIARLPASAYDRSAVYLNLALFWIGVIVLVVLLRLKLREIERVQTFDRPGRDREPQDLD